MNYLLLHAMAAFLVLPGMVAFFIPLAWVAPGGPDRFANPFGLVPLAIGVAPIAHRRLFRLRQCYFIIVVSQDIIGTVKHGKIS